jgi:hypothetical protein
MFASNQDYGYDITNPARNGWEGTNEKKCAEHQNRGVRLGRTESQAEI